jgi:hypothetical protein
LAIDLIGESAGGQCEQKERQRRHLDINESKNGDLVKIFIVQVTALSCAATQVPEITAAIQSFSMLGFAVPPKWSW